MKLLTVPAFACLALALASGAPAQATVQAAPAVAVAQASVEDPSGAPIPVAIWAPATGTSLPLVVISHGTGAGPTSHIDTAQALARAGFVVVAPMHPGDNFQDDSAVGQPRWLADRSRHVSRAIDFMFARWEGRSRLIPNRVGIFGFSAGATTALISIGGVPDLGRLAPHCAAQREFVCNLVRPASDLATSEPPRWTHDPRIAAAVIAAPGLGFLFEPAGLAEARAHVQLWTAAEDETVPYATNGAVVRRLLPRSPDFHRVADAVHLSFLAPCTPETPAPLCQDRPGFDRAAFHQRFNEAVTAFFRQHLAEAPSR
jgi:predicted dienelactone hydrolase